MKTTAKPDFPKPACGSANRLKNAQNKGSSQQPEADLTSPSAKSRLLEAATFEFAQLGFAGARMQTIAEAAKINKQLIYYYYGNKEQLYNAVLENMVKNISALVRNPAAKSEGDAVLSRTISLLKALQRKPVQFWGRLLMFEALEQNDVIHMEAERRRTYRHGSKAVARAQTEGTIDPKFDHLLLTFLLIGLPLLPFLLPQLVRLITDLEPTSDNFIRQWQDLIEDIYGRLAPLKSKRQ
jgi:AcrR family transcriptional regulator